MRSDLEPAASSDFERQLKKTSDRTRRMHLMRHDAFLGGLLKLVARPCVSHGKSKSDRNHLQSMGGLSPQTLLRDPQICGHLTPSCAHCSRFARSRKKYAASSPLAKGHAVWRQRLSQPQSHHRQNHLFHLVLAGPSLCSSTRRVPMRHLRNKSRLPCERLSGINTMSHFHRLVCKPAENSSSSPPLIRLVYLRQANRASCPLSPASFHLVQELDRLPEQLQWYQIQHEASLWQAVQILRPSEHLPAPTSR